MYLYERAGYMNKQNGWTLWTMLLTAIIVGFFAYLVMRLFPPYLDNLKIREAMELVIEEPGFHSMTKRQIVKRMNRKLYIDYARDVVDLNRALHIEKDKAKTTLVVGYESAVHIAYNISALLDFENRVETINQ